MVADAPSVFEAGLQLASESSDSDHEYDEAFKEQGYSYGTEPITAKKGDLKQVEYQTPAPKPLQNGSRDSIYELDATNRGSTDKKRITWKNSTSRLLDEARNGMRLWLMHQQCSILA